MQAFVKKFYPGSKEQTFFESCGVADLITTCFGGRNRKCAEAFASRCKGAPAKTTAELAKLWAGIEAELLNGQKLQGTLTCEEIVSVLRKNKCEAEFPFIMAVQQISFEGAHVGTFYDLLVAGDEKAAAMKA